MVARGNAVILAMVALSGLAIAEAGDLGDFFKKSGNKKEELKPCFGDTRFGKKDGKKPICQHEGFRFCMRLMQDNGEPYLFGDVDSENATEVKEDVNSDGLDWWEWSTQPDNKKAWMKGILNTGGHHWCTCALCTSEAVTRFGCDKLDIDCDASDVAFIRSRVEKDKHMVLEPGLKCLVEKCGVDFQKDWPVIGNDCKHRGCARLYGAGYEHALMPLPEAGNPSRVTIGLAVATVAGFLVSLVAGVAIRRHALAPRPLLDVEAEESSASNDAVE